MDPRLDGEPLVPTPAAHPSTDDSHNDHQHACFVLYSDIPWTGDRLPGPGDALPLPHLPFHFHWTPTLHALHLADELGRSKMGSGRAVGSESEDEAEASGGGSEEGEDTARGRRKPRPSRRGRDVG